jgi:hypothetical protein
VQNKKMALRFLDHHDEKILSSHGFLKGWWYWDKTVVGPDAALSYLTSYDKNIGWSSSLRHRGTDTPLWNGIRGFVKQNLLSWPRMTRTFVWR